MSVPDRPTREAVERALKMLDGSILAAEVRALRAEMERHAAEAHQQAGLASRLRDDLDEARAALAARTPQPAGVLCSWCGSTVALSADGLLVSHCDPAFTGQDRRCGASGTGQFESTAPLPAVPDGEDEPCGSCGHDADHSGGECMWFDDVRTDDGHMQVACHCDGSPNPDTDPDDPLGEDVPARLDAAAEVFNALGAEWGTVADYLSMTADELRDNCTPDVRAAVAAALARPTEPGHG